MSGSEPVWRAGGCHCGAVRFEARLADEVEAQTCTCSMCEKVGFVHVIVPESRFRLLQGADQITTYTFNTGVAQHTFCAVCGVKPFYRPRSNPDGWSVNARCLDETARPALKLSEFDGRNWEAHAADLAHLFQGDGMTDVLMPALSPTMEEGTLAKWHVKVGDNVRSGDVIAEIETDKATMEVEAVDEGVIEELLVPEGTEEVKVNTPIARLKGEGEAASPPPSPLRGGVGGGGETPALQTHAKAEAKPADVRTTRPPPTPSPQGGGERQASDGKRIFASPLARRIAKDAGLDLAQVKGSGPHGRIIRRDVEGLEAAPAKAQPATQPAAAPKPAAAPAEAPRKVASLEQMGIAPGSYDLVPLDGMKKTIARRMTDSFRDVPHFPLTIDLEIDALLAARAKINGMLEKGGVKVSVNDMLIKAAAVALKRQPDANASYTPEGIARHHHADIAVAVAIEGGLITPIVRSAETKGLAEIAVEMKDLAERARTRKLKPEEFQGGTFSISNLGMFGIKSFASIINEPQGAILSVGVGEKRPVVRGDELAVATVMTVTLTCDHRVVDGAIGARWLGVFKALVEDPITMIV